MIDAFHFPLSKRIPLSIGQGPVQRLVTDFLPLESTIILLSMVYSECV
ncbi:hypothetical protein VIBNIAM115_1600025 [Vibrio nigripulchritudo AM115]|nr:hypothetical protein VIBNIAM115_1600025 [Vibrio nigripulchritudo AM115]